MRMMWWMGSRWLEKSWVDDVGLFDCRLGHMRFDRYRGMLRQEKSTGMS